MRTTVGLLSAVLFVAFPVSAQEMVAWERFVPGEVGDYWQYETVRRECWGYETPTCHSETTTSRTYTLVSRSEVADTLTLEVQTEASLCRLIIAEGDDWFTVEQVAGERCLPLHLPFDMVSFTVDEPFSPTTITVGAIEHEVTAVKGIGGYSHGLHRFAADLGMYEFYSLFVYEGQITESHMTLQRARVEGMEYGAPVAVEPDASGASARLDAYPNPFQDRLVLRLEGARTTASPFVSVEVYDLLGRRVRSEGIATEVAVVGLGSLAPGTYVIRAVGPDGTVLTRRATKLR